MNSKILKVIEFNCLEELQNFENDFKQFQQNKNSKKEEHRGSKTKFLHQKVKEYLKENNDVSYKMALKMVGKQMKESKQKKE